jgi:hypothetical protein
MPNSTRKTAAKFSKHQPPPSGSPRSAATAPHSGEKDRGASKQAHVVNMLHAPVGSTIEAIMRKTDSQPHSVGGFLASVVRKMLTPRRESSQDAGQRDSRIVDVAPPRAGTARSNRHAA